MKQIVTIALSILFCFKSIDLNGQLKTVDDVIQDIEFQSDTIKSVFDWIAVNIDYDVDKLDRIIKNKSKKEIKPPIETRIAQLLSHKKGVCEDYSLLFREVLSSLGYNVFQVVGYSRSLVTNEISMNGHAWNVIEIDGKWKFYDPTWAAGYVKNKKFTREYNPVWYDVNVDLMAQTHMPYDPIWQLSNQPLKYSGFDKSTKSNIGSSIDYQSLIKEHQTKPKEKRAADELSRIKSLGRTNEVVDRRIEYLKGLMTNTRRNDDAFIFNKAMGQLRNAYDRLENLRKAANRQFQSEPWTDVSYTDKYFEETSTLVLEVKSELKSITKVKDKRRIEDLKNNIAICDDYLDLLEVYKQGRVSRN